MSKCVYTGDFCTFTSDLVFRQLRAKKVTFYDSLRLAMVADVPLNTVITWAKMHLKNDDILVATRGMMTITSMISQMYQQRQVRKAHLARDRLSQELQLFEHVYNRYSGPGENALLVEIAKRKHQLELAKLYEEPYDSKPEPCAYHEELIEQYESSTEELTEQRRTKEERSREASDSPPPSSGNASPNLDD